MYWVLELSEPRREPSRSKITGSANSIGAKGDFVQKKIKNDVHAKWKDEIIALVVERKLNNMDVDLSEAEDEGDLKLENDVDNLINQVNDLQIDDLDELIYDLNISYEDEEQAMEQ
uniref:Uncharacterized protein n=1 Tax=Acrobeloides nanus TaxID=290746 RepID=A0A914DZB9_9BILA